MLHATPESANMQSPKQSTQPGDVWKELFETVAGLGETLELCLQAMAPDSVVGDKVVSATTKKRIAIKAMQNLKHSKDNMQVLQEHLKALQAASQQWQRSMMYASKSHEELMDQLEHTNRDLQLTTERARTLEAQHLASVREAEAQRVHILNMESEYRALQNKLKQREEDLETAHFGHAEFRARMEQYQSEAAAAVHEKLAALQARDRAVALLDGARSEADKAVHAAQRHQEAVAKLTADNLVFLMNLKKAEAELAAANQERSQLKLAAEKQRGPWFDEVRASVEERVRQAMSRAETLEAEMEAKRAQHANELQELQSQKSDLEEYVAELKGREESMQAQLAAAQAAAEEAEARRAAAHTALERAQQQAEELGVRNSMLQEDVAKMRQECTERWVAEQAALGKVSGLESSIAALEQSLSQLQARAQQLENSLSTQMEVNRQLMRKKEETEWELMAALAKAAAPAGSGGMGASAPVAAGNQQSQFTTPARPAAPTYAAAAPPNSRASTVQSKAVVQTAAPQPYSPAPTSFAAHAPASGGSARSALGMPASFAHQRAEEAAAALLASAPVATPTNKSSQASMAPQRERASVQHTPVPQRTPQHALAIAPRPYGSPQAVARSTLDPQDEGVYSAYVFDLKRTSPLASPSPKASPRSVAADPHPVMNASQEVSRSGPLPAPLPSDIAQDPDRKTVDITCTQPIHTAVNPPPPALSSDEEESDAGARAAGTQHSGKAPEYIVDTNTGSLKPIPGSNTSAQAVPTLSVLKASDSNNQMGPAPDRGLSCSALPSQHFQGSKENAGGHLAHHPALDPKRRASAQTPSS